MLCARCGDRLPENSRRNKVYCSKACSNAAYKAAVGVDIQKQRAYSRASYRRLRAVRLAEIGQRKCPECGDALPERARLRKRFCSRYCINQVSLRERRYARYAATERRRLKLLGGEHVGVAERDWLRLIARYGGRCAYCASAKPLTKDHVIPVSRGGRHSIGNLLPACQSCNSSKRDEFLAAWRLGRTTARAA